MSRISLSAIIGLAVAGTSFAGVSQVVREGRIEQAWPTQANWWNIPTSLGASYEQVVFDEKACFLLAANTNVDGGTLGPSDGRMSCSLTVGHDNRHDYPLGTLVEYDDLVLGTVSDKLTLETWDGLCGRPGVIYPSNMADRGLESNDSGPFVNLDEVENTPVNDIIGDHLRVVTECSQPMAASWSGPNAPTLNLTQSGMDLEGEVCDGSVCYVAVGQFVEPDVGLSYSVGGVLHEVSGELSDDGQSFSGSIVTASDVTNVTWSR